MASVAMLIGGALANALAFSGSSFLFSSLSKNKIDAERKRHDKAIEDMQKAQIEWSQKRQEHIDFINNEITKENKAEKRFNDLADAMQQYYIVTGKRLPKLPPKPVLSDFYIPSDDHKDRELAFIALSMIGVGVVLYYYEKVNFFIILD